MKKQSSLSAEQIDRIIEMAWEDRTPFDAILIQFGLKEEAVIKLMRSEMKPSSFKMWRSRVQGRKTKHLKSCLLYTSPSPRDLSTSRMPSSA